MAAGLGFKTFTTGEVLTAANVNGYLMQGVLVFASAAARDAAITSPQEGQACYLKDTNEVLTYSGSAWVAVGGSGLTYASYSPSYTSLTVGNGTVISRYAQTGKFVHLFFKFTLGSTSSISGSPTISLPVTAANTGSNSTVYFDDAGTAGLMGFTVMTSTTAMTVYYVGAATAYTQFFALSSTLPFTWATGDVISFQISYEAA